MLIFKELDSSDSALGRVANISEWEKWNISAFHGNDYEDCRLLGCDTVSFLWNVEDEGDAFLRNVFSYNSYTASRLRRRHSSRKLGVRIV
jgi:hypothetical protein